MVEVSPTTEAMIETKGRLLTQLDAEMPNEVWSIATKAKSYVVETRDRVHSKLITGVDQSCTHDVALRKQRAYT